MQAFTLEKYGQPIARSEVPEPEVGECDVLLRVETAGLNRLDNLIQMGVFKYVLPYKLPQILGNEVAGTVLAVGSRVTSFLPGDFVYSRQNQQRMGTFAERVSVADRDVAMAPTSIPRGDVGSLPLVALTAWQALVEKGNVQRGQKVLIHGGAGGVGSIAIQLAKHLGASVATTASPIDHDFVRELGADVIIDYHSQRFDNILKDYDVVLDTVGGETLQRSLRVLRPGGKVIGLVGTPDPAFARELRLNPLLRLTIAVLSAKIRRQAKKRRVSYHFLFVRADGGQLAKIAALVDAGKIRPVVSRVFPFEQTAAAIDWLPNAHVRGKAIVTHN